MYALRSSVMVSRCETARAVTAAVAAMGLPSGGRAVGRAISVNYRAQPAAVSPGNIASASRSRPAHASVRDQRTIAPERAGAPFRMRSTPSAIPSSRTQPRRGVRERARWRTCLRLHQPPNPPQHVVEAGTAFKTGPDGAHTAYRPGQGAEDVDRLDPLLAKDVQNSHRACAVAFQSRVDESNAPNRALSATVPMTSSTVIGRPSASRCSLSISCVHARRLPSLRSASASAASRLKATPRAALRSTSSEGGRGRGRGTPRPRRRRLRGP